MEGGEQTYRALLQANRSIYRDYPRRRGGRREQIAPSGSRTRQPQRPLFPLSFPSSFVPKGERSAVKAPLYPCTCTHTHPSGCPAPGEQSPSRTPHHLPLGPPLQEGGGRQGRRRAKRGSLMGAAPSQHIAESLDTAPTAARRAASVKERQGEGRGGGRRDRGRWGGSLPSSPAGEGECAAGRLRVVTWGWEVRIGKKRRGEAEVLVTSWHHLSAVRPGAESPPYSEAV